MALEYCKFGNNVNLNSLIKEGDDYSNRIIRFPMIFNISMVPFQGKCNIALKTFNFHIIL